MSVEENNTNPIAEVSDMIGGKSTTNDPTGVTAAKRLADNGGSAEPMPSVDPKNGPSSKAEIISYLTDYVAGLSADNAMSFYQKIAAEYSSKDATYSGSSNPGTSASKTIVAKEDLESVFASDESLSEEFKFKAMTIFEAAMNASIKAELVRIEEENESKLAESVEAVKTELAEKVGKFVDYIAETWVESNKLAIVSSIKTQAVDSFLSGLKGLFAEHYVSIPDDKVDVVESLSGEVSSLESKLNEEAVKNIELRAELNALKAKAVLESTLEGLTDTQKDRVRALAETVKFTTDGEYTSKLTTIRESVAPVVGQTIQEDKTIDPVEAPAATPSIDPEMKAIMDAISRTKQK